MPCVVLLAAGAARRFGSAKLLATLDGEPLVRRAACAAREAGAALVVVTGRYADEVRHALDGLEATIVHNPEWEDGMGASIAAAFRHLASATDAVDAAIVCPADLPKVGAPQLQRLLDAHRAAPDRIVASDLGSAIGAPCLFPRRFFGELAALSGAQGARVLLDRHAALVTTVGMPEAALDVDTPADLAALASSRNADADRIPERWEDLTPEWIGASLAARHPGARVGTVQVATRDDGTNRRARLALTYAAGAGPSTLFLKANDPAHRAVHLRNGNLFNEARLFRSDVVLDVDHPVVYRAIVDEAGGNFLIVMEDLAARGADPRDATRPLTVEQVANGLRGLAHLHAPYWNFNAASHPRLAWVQTWAPTEGWQVGLRKRIPIGLGRIGDAIPDAIRRLGGDGIVDLWGRYVAQLVRGPVTLLHGDAHIGNTYVLPDGGVGFLDWQVVRRGNWSQDVGYFLVGSLTEDDRRRKERELLEAYRDALDLPATQRPSREAAWLAYRASAAYGLAIWLSTMGTDGWQSPDVSRALVARYAAAFVELDTPAALDALEAAASPG
ncbi:MAG TPA: NTP transferase domain-containing protein [Nevskiaceae bacterium]|nr:NTP transferase domain-containing protein [Nevskiaceae bacterium]